MLLTSWIRALRQSFTRHRLSRARRKQADARRQNSRRVRLAEVLEERSLLSIKPLVIDINPVTNTNVFTSTASTPGINITNSLLDPNNDGISDYDDLLIGVSQSSTFESTVIGGAGIGIRINLSNLTGLNHISIDNVFITAGANQQGISITLDNVALQSLAVDQTNVAPAATGTGGVGLDINLKNMSSTAGLDVSVQNSNIRSGSTSLNGVNVTLESVSKGTHVGELTLSDSTVEGYSVATSANSTLYAAIDQASVRNSRIQSGAANPNARGITYTLNRTVVGDLRVEDNVNFRNVAVTTTDSPLKTVSISDNPNIDLSGVVATDTIRDAVRINATSTNTIGAQRSDVTNLRITGNTIGGNLANTNTANGIVLSLSDSNLGDYSVPYAGARIAGNSISNLSGTANNPAAAISIFAAVSSGFVAGNGGRPLLLDFDGDGTANDTNGITQNTLTNNNGRGIVVTGRPDTTFLADVTANTILGGAAPNRREAALLTVAVKPTLPSADSFSLNFSDNTITGSQGSAVSIAVQDSAVGNFVIRNNEITNTTSFPVASTVTATVPNGLSVVLEGTNTNQEATNLLKSSVIEGNFIGITRPTAANPAGTAGPNAANGIFINTQEASVVQNLQILNNTLRNNGVNNTHAGLLFLREDRSVLASTSVGERAVVISGNTVGTNRNGILLDARNGSIDLLDFELSNNFIGVDATGADIGNIDDGINLRTEADARMLADVTNNQIRFNNGSGINLNNIFSNFSTDKRQIGGTWINNTISDNTQNGILITGRHGLSDETTGVNTPLVIGLEGQGNLIENNGGNGIRIYGPLSGTNNSIRSTATGEVSITNNIIRRNSGGRLPNIVDSNAGIFVRSAQEKLDIRHNQIEANVGKGIDLEVVHGIPTLPTNVGLPGAFAVTIRDNVVTGQLNGPQITTDNGDGIEISSFETVRFLLSALTEDNSALNLLNALIVNNFVDSNEGRGIDVLNIGSGTMQVRIGDGTNEGRNTVVGNGLDGIRVLNTGDRTQPQDGVPIDNGNPGQFPNLGTPIPQQSNDATFAPDIMLDVSRNTIRDNGIDLPAPRQTGGISDVNATGLVVLAGAVGQGAGAIGTGLDYFPNEVGVNSGDPLAGNGRINMRVTDNVFEGNFGNDFAIVPYIAVIPPTTTGVWDTNGYNFNMVLDPLIRVNAVVTGNTGNGMDVIRPAPDYINNEDTFKSRLRSPARVPGGPFGSGTRPRNATRLATDDIPLPVNNGQDFVYPGYDERFLGVLGTPQPTTLRVEAGFDRSGTTAGFAFYSPSAPGPGSEDNFDDPLVTIINGRVDTIWDTVLQGTFTFPNVDSPTYLTASVSNFPTLGNTSPGTVTVNFSEYVQFVDITDFRLLRDNSVVSLAGLAVSPVNSSEDPNNPGAFRSFTINLSTVTSLPGNYQFQVLAVDSSNPTFSAIRDVHFQFNNQGNSLTRITDGDGVLQDYTLNHRFTVDSSRPVATISPITPDPRNAAAGIVTITFDEPTTGVDIADFQLFRDIGLGPVAVNLGSVTVNAVSSTEYTLNLNQLSGAPGTYELRLVTTDLNTPIQDLAGNLVAENFGVGIASSDTWLVDTTLPFVTSIADALPPDVQIDSPRNAQPGSIIINFSEAVSGVDNSDFTLLRTNTDGTVSKVDISSPATFPLFQLTADQYELNLAALAATAGTYKLTINPLNSGIVDTAGNAFLTSFSTSWVLDVANPLADIVDIVPDPRQTPVDALNTIFNEKVNGVNTANASAQYVLSFDDGTATTAGSITDTTNAGPIVVTSPGHGLANGDRITIYGVVGNTNANGVFNVQNVIPGVSFELAGSVGNGIYTGGGRWVRTVSLAGLTISQQTDTRYVLNLSSVTLDQGTYIISLLADGTITDDAGNAVGAATGQFNVAAQDIWTNGPDAAPTGTIAPITTPRGTNAGLVTVTFSEPLQKINGNSPVDFKDFKLTRGATTISLAGVPITQTGPTTYTLDLSGAGVTDVDGTYTLQLLNTDTVGASATPLRDLTGNLLSNDSDPLTASGIASQVVWVKDGTLSGPQVTTFRDVQRNNNLGSITKLREVQTLEINFTDNVQGVDLTDASKNFLLTRQATGGVPIPVSLDGIAVQQVTAKQYRITLSTLTGTDGTYRFTVLANGLIKNATTLVDLKNPQTVQWTKDGTMRPSTVGDSTDSNQGNEVVGSGSNYSLRQAVQEANALAGDDVIELGAGTYTLSLAGIQEDNAAVGDLDIRQNLVIRGKGVGVTIIDASALANQVTATNRDRLFQILANVTVTIQGVTIQMGAVTGSEDGGAIRNSGNLTILDSLIQNNTSQDDAGAINNNGTLTIDRTTISGNTSVATGGAIRNAGTLFMTNSTLSNNRTTGASGHGGALMNVATFSATLEGVTISGNTAQNAAGGGIRNDGTLRLVNDTIAFNRSLSAGAGISRNLGTVTIGNTIVSDNTLTNTPPTASDVAGTFTSIGGNLVRTPGTAVGFNAAIGDQLNVNPNLQPLANNGGPTQTHALPAFDSTGLNPNPAIDRGLNANVTNQNSNTSLDQRGALRFLDGPNTQNSVDVGAFEFGTFFVNTTDDSRDVNLGDGLAEDGLRQTSLRAAIMESNALGGESAIMLDGQVYSLKRLAPDTTAPVVTSITGVPLAPITTGGVGVVTITFSERVAGFDLADITLTRTVGGVVSPVLLPAATFQLTKVSDLIYKIENKADIAAGVTNTGLTSITQTNGLYNLTVNAGGAAGSNIRDIENNFLGAAANVNWVRGVDTFAPTVSVVANSAVVAAGGSDFITNGGIVTVTFSERVTGVSANNFTLTRNGTPVLGLVVTPVTDNNFNGRTVVSLNLQTLTAANGNYVLTLNPNVGANVTIKDTANNNLAAGGSISWTKVANVRFEPINTPRVDEVTKIRVQFTERVAGVKLDDFTLTFDDGSGVGPQPVSLTQATLAPVGTLTAVPNFGNAAEQWELTFSNKQAARDGQYVLSFDGLTNGNQLVTTATTATVVVPFVPTTATLPFQIGEDQSNIGDLDVVVGAGRVQIFGKGKDDSTTVLGNPQPRTVIDGNLTDRIFDLTIGANVVISGVEMINGKIVYERSGGAIRNFGTLTLNDDDLLSNSADGNGGAVYNAAPFGLQVAITGTQQGSPVLQAAVNNVANTLTFNSLEAFPSDLPFVLQVQSEQMLVTAVNLATNQVTVTRGFNGTVAAGHAALTVVTQLSRAGNLTATATTTATTLTVSSVTAFPANVPFTILVDSEQMQVTAVSAATNQFTVVRGFNATVPTVHANNASVTPLTPTAALASAITNVATTLTLDSITAYPSNAPFTILVGNEQIQVIAVNSATNQFTVIRGINGTAAVAQAQGTGVSLLTSDAVSATTSILTLTNVAAFPSNAPFVILVDSEQMRVTAINAALNQFTVDRGYNGTTAASHAANVTVTLLPSTTFNRSNFSNNIAGSAASGSQFGKGGAIFNDNGAITINEGTYSSNGAVTDGGAIYNGNQATASLLSTTFTGNLAGRDGGAIYNNDTAILTISSSTLNNNRADAVVSGIASDTNGDGGAIYNETSAKLVLDDSLLQSNSARNGGALYNDDGTLVLNRDTFGVNSALENGGAIYNTSGGSLTLNQGLFTTNSASDNGGAIQNFGNLVVLDVPGTGTQFLSNEAGTDVRPGDADNGKGAAIFNKDGVVDISSATFTLNRSHGDAGAIMNDGDGTLTIRRTTFSLNSADGSGGVLVNNDFAQLIIDEVSFSNNSADGDGGAIYNNSEFSSGSTRSLTIDDSTLNSNSANHGGAIFNTSFGGLTMTNTTLSGNTATTNGGGLANFGSASLLNSTLYLNNAPEGAGIANNVSGIPPFGQATLKNTLVAGGTSGADIADGAIAFGGSSFVDGGHNLIEDIGTVAAFNNPLNGNVLGQNPQLDILRDNGGPTLTHALLFGSPARDAGDNFAVTLNDQRGLNRVFDGDGNGVATVDIGAFESGFVVNSFLDTVDENPGDGINADANGRSTLRAAIMEANARPGEDTIILGPGIFTLTLTGRAEDFRLNSAGNIASSSETGDLDILDDLNIIGAGTDLTFIDAAQIDRIFQIFPGVNLKLSNLTLQNGNATSTDFGGAIFNQGATTLDNVLVINSSAGRGGGIYNDSTGTLTIEDSLFRGNQAVQQGGALYNDGTLTVTRTEVGAVSRLAAAIPSSVATTITVMDVSEFPTSGPFVIQVDAERMLVTSILGNAFTVVRGYNGTVAAAHQASAFATQGNVANIHGGGLYNLGIATITQSSFSGNLAQSRGGGLYNAALTGTLTAAINAAQPTFTLTSVAGFPTTGSFTIQIDSERMTVTNVNPVTNLVTVIRGLPGTIAAAHAAGAQATSVGQNQTTIQQSTFLDNFASSRGAAIYNEEDLTIKNSTLSNNDSGTNAALGNSVSGRVTIENSTVVDNVAYRGGGLSNSLIGSVAVHNTIVANNSSTSITGAKAPNVRGTFTTQGNNFIGNNSDSLGFVNNTNFDQVGSGTSPFDPVLKALANNGGPTQTHSARTGSPIIDAGNNTGGDPFDQRGAIRPTNSDSDIGAVEQQDVHVTINDVSRREGNSGSTIFTFTLSLNKPSIQEVRVHYTLQGDTAFADEDFVNATGDVVFAPNQLNQTLEVVVNGDTTVEPDEQFLVNLSIPADATFTPTLDRTQAVGTILSDDTGIRITNVNKVELDPGAANQLYVFNVSVVGAALAPGEVVSVDYSIGNGTATLGSDYLLSSPATGTLTFTAGSMGELPASQTITVLVTADQLVEANETFFVDLSNITSSMSSLAVNAFEFGKSRGVGTIFNDDLGFNVSSPLPPTQEGTPAPNDNVAFTVSLQQRVYVTDATGTPVQATITANVATADGSANSGSGGDYTSTSQTVTFTGTTTTAQVLVPVLDDLRFESNETFQLRTIAGFVNGVVDPNAVQGVGVGTISDNDPPPDQWRVFLDAGTTEIVVNYSGGGAPEVEVVRLPYATTPSFEIRGDRQGVFVNNVFVGLDVGADTTRDDLFIVDFTTGLNPIPVGGMAVHGLTQNGADGVEFRNGGTFGTVVYDSFGPGNGRVTFDGSTVDYDGLEPVVDKTFATNRIFNAPVGGSDNIFLSSSGGSTTISSAAGLAAPTFESVTFSSENGIPTNVTINGGTGANNIVISGGDSNFPLGLTVNAGNGNDTINLTDWSLTSTVFGGFGNDSITGGAGADAIDGGDGNDTIAGGLGSDTIFGQAGTDNLSGGGGDDLIAGGDGNDTVLGDAGNDILDGGSGNDSVDGGADNDTVDGGADNDTVGGGDGNDTVLGNDGNDTLTGGNGNDSLDGGFGDDSMAGNAGTDTINGQMGSDIVEASGNANITLTNTLVTVVGLDSDQIIQTERAHLIGGAGANLIDASTFIGSVTVEAGAGNDTVLGGLGNDSIVAGDGNDSVMAGSGNDTINGGLGNDKLFGEADDDSITGDAGTDTIDGGAGNDFADGGAGNDMLTGGDGIDTLQGGADNDTLTGGDSGDSLLGDAGQDLINGDNGDDTIDGGDGDDTAFGDNGNDFVGGGAGNDTLEGNLGDDSVNGMDGNDTLDGNAGFDTLFGGTGDDEMISNDGNDQLLGQGGSRDTFTFNGDASIADIFTITLAGNGFTPPTGIALARLNPGLQFTTVILGVELFTLNLNGGNDLVTIDDLTNVTDLNVLNIYGGDGDDTIDGHLSLSPTIAMKLFMGAGNDSVQGTSAADTINGEAGNDTIIANDGADSIAGGDGNDSLNGGGYGSDMADTINGGNGDDSIWGGAGADSILGMLGKDTIWGQGGNDTIDGGDNDDFLDGGYGNSVTAGSGNDSIIGGAGNDKIAGRDGKDTLLGGDGNDTINGGEDNDSIDGGNGDDLVEGGDGNDTINGGAGNDILMGGTGDDSILGGAGNDRLIGEAGKDTLDGQGGTDTVVGGNGLGTNTLSVGEKRIGETINELFKITSIRASIFGELNF